MSIKDKSKEKRLSSVIARNQWWLYIVAIMGLIAMVVFIVLYYTTKKILYFYLLIGFGLAAVVFVLVKVAIIPYTVSKLVTSNLTDDMSRALVSVSTGKKDITMSKSGIVEFDDLKKRLTDVMNSFSDVVLIDRSLDEKALKLGYEYGFDGLITKDSFLYNLPFILKLNASSRGGLVFIKIIGDESTPTNKAVNELLSDIKKNFTTKIYIGKYSSDTFIVYVSDVESISMFKNLLYRLYYSYSVLKSELSKDVIYTVKIGAAVFPYSTNKSILTDAKEALDHSVNVNIFIPTNFSSRSGYRVSIEDIRRNDIISIEKLIGYLYHFGSLYINEEEISSCLLPVMKNAGFETVGIVCKPTSSSFSGNENMTCLEEVGDPFVTWLKGRTNISFDEIRPFYDFKDEDDIFYCTRREDLPPVLAEYFDRHNLNAMFCSFFGEKDQILGMTYMISSKRISPVSSVDNYVLSLAMIILNFITANKLGEIRSKLVDNDLETVLAIDDKLRYLVNEKSFSLEGMSEGLLYAYGKGKLGSKCYNAFFGLDAPCKDCPLLSGKNGDAPVTYMNKKFMRRKLSFNTVDNISSILLEPYKNEEEKRKQLARFDPFTCLSSRNSFNETISDLVSAKAKGTLLLIYLEGVNEIVSSYGETNLNNILIDLKNRIIELHIAERIYRYDDATLAIYFDGATRIQVYDYVEKIQEVITPTYLIENKQLKCSFKYSEVNFSTTFAAPSDVFSLIEKGLTQAKKLPSNTLSIANENISRVASKSEYVIYLMEENYLNKAVEFRIQPILSTKDNSIRYGEILLRLYDSLREKMLDPREIVQIASENNKMGKFDSLNYENAISLYNKYSSGAFRIYSFNGFSINLSSDSLESNDWLNRIRRYISANPTPNGFLGFEIREADFPSKLGRIKVWHNELSSFSLNWLIDNYEDQYITPREAAEMGFKVLKLSRKFLIDATADPIAKGLFDSVIREAHYNKLLVVCQGVETKEQFDFCCKLGADYIQGFYLFEPLKIDEFLSALAEKPDKKKLYDWSKNKIGYSSNKRSKEFVDSDKKMSLRRKLIIKRQQKKDKEELKDAKKKNKLQDKAEKEEVKVDSSSPKAE